MIDWPSLQLKLSPSETWQVTPSFATRIMPVVERLMQAGWFQQDLSCRIEVLAVPPAHVGLGSGTQMAMAVATA